MIFQDHTRGTGLDDPRYSFCFCSRLYVGCICPFFSDSAIFPVAFFSIPESGYFFSVESTPENSRRHLVAELLITASLHAARPILRLSLSACFFFPFPDLEFRRCTYVYTYGSCNRRIPRARLLGTNETRPFAWCRLVNGVASRRIGGTGIGEGGLQDYIDVETPLQDHPARQYKITFVRQTLSRPLSARERKGGGSD